MSVVAVQGGRASPRARRAPRAALADRRRDRDVVRVGRPGRPARARRRTLMLVLVSWAVGLVLGAASLADGTDAAGPVPGLGLGCSSSPGRSSGGLGGVQVADRVFMVRLSPPRSGRRVLRDLRAGRQGVAGRRPAAVRRDRVPARSTRWAWARTRSRCCQPDRDDAHRRLAHRTDRGASRGSRRTSTCRTTPVAPPRSRTARRSRTLPSAVAQSP